MDPAAKLFQSSASCELWQVKGGKKSEVAEAPLEVYAASGAGGAPPARHYPVLSALLAVGAVKWTLSHGTHVMRSSSEAGEPTYIFSGVDPGDVDVFYCAVFKRTHPGHELEALQQVLTKVATFHVNAAALKKNAPPLNLPLPQVDPKVVNEIMRKAAEDTQSLLRQAGDAANAAFRGAAEMHKRYAPKPAAQPVVVPQGVKDSVGKTKQAAAAGAAVAKGVATGMTAATTEIGASLAQTVAAATTGGNKAGSGSGSGNGKDNGGGGVPAPLAAVGGIGVELLRDMAAVRDALLASAGKAWEGARSATEEVLAYQYGAEVAGVARDANDSVEGAGKMAMAMRMAAPTQVVLTSAKETTARQEQQQQRQQQLQAGVGGATGGAAGAAADERAALERERAQLEKERAELAAERARLAAAAGGGSNGNGGQQQQQQQQQQRKGPFGLFPAFQ